jgi:hypothetical protein
MAWCLFAIATRPEVESRIVKELDSLGLLASPLNPNPRDLTLEDLPKLVYLNAVIKETMRYHTVSSFAPVSLAVLCFFYSFLFSPLYQVRGCFYLSGARCKSTGTGLVIFVTLALLGGKGEREGGREWGREGGGREKMREGAKEGAAAGVSFCKEEILVGLLQGRVTQGFRGIACWKPSSRPF